MATVTLYKIRHKVTGLYRMRGGGLPGRWSKKGDTWPNVGDIVRFNDYGLEQVFGSAMGKSFMKKLELRITRVDSESMTYPEPTFVVEVDDPEINQFLIDSNCFDIVRRA